MFRFSMTSGEIQLNQSVPYIIIKFMSKQGRIHWVTMGNCTTLFNTRVLSLGYSVSNPLILHPHLHQNPIHVCGRTILKWYFDVELTRIRSNYRPLLNVTYHSTTYVTHTYIQIMSHHITVIYIVIYVIYRLL